MGIEPSSEGMQGMAASSMSSPQEQQQQGNPNSNGSPHYDHPSQDDFLDQMISNLASWPDMAPSAYPATTSLSNNPQRLFTMSLMSNKPENTTSSPENMPYPAPSFDDSSMLASRLRQHQISGMGGGNSPGSRPLGLLQLNTGNLGLKPSQLLSSRALRSPTSASCMSEGGSLPLPLSLGQGNPDSPDPHLLGSRDDVEAPFKTGLEGAGGIQGLYNGFQARAAQSNSQHFQSYGGQSGGMSQPPASGSGAAGGTAPARPRVRARRGQATDPHSIAERLRRERIAERMKALQELVPNANKTDKASMLDEIIDYVKFLQLQVKVLSMSRLGGAAAVAPLVADISEAGARRNAGGDQPTASSQDSLTAAEHQVAKMMEEDMGSAMQYLQGKGLCLMPISLASAISTATCHTRNPSSSMLASNLDRPSSPSMSVLTVQSALGGNSAGGDADISRLPGKDSNSVAKP